jgi:hypothetical protein
MKSAINIPVPQRVNSRDSVKSDWANQVRDCIQRLAMRREVNLNPGRFVSGPGQESTCPFGKIVTYADGEDTITAILGGLFICGNKNFNVANREINLESDGSWLIKLTLSGVDPATDDDDEIFLSGVVTASGTPTWGAIEYTGSESYTPNTNPATPSGTGTLVIPIGILKVDDGDATLSPTGCGRIVAGQCAGILSYSRG